MIRTLLGVDLVLVVATAALWIAAAVVGMGIGPGSSRGRTVSVVLLSAAGSAATLTRVGVVLALASAGWSFVEEKVLLALPLALIGAVAGVWGTTRGLARPVRALSARAITALFAAACCAVAAVAIQFVVGSPLTAGAAAATVSVVVLTIVLTHLLFSSASRRAVAGACALLVLVLAASGGWSWMSDRAAWSQLELPGASHAHAAPALDGGSTTSVADLRTPLADEPDARFELHARDAEVVLPSGARVSAWTFGGTLPGPELRVSEGDLVEVLLVNDDIGAGVTIHWHGVDVPNGEDGVAGVTQDAVLPGESFTYRFVADDPGTYWYHSHQASAEGVVKGLYGSLIVEPRTPAAPGPELDIALPLHSFANAIVFGDSDLENIIGAAEGDVVRVRLINTDQRTQRFALAGAPFSVVAADGRDLVGAGKIEGRVLSIPAGGRLDLQFRMPSSPVSIAPESAQETTVTFVVQATGADGAPTVAPDFTAPEFDLLTYGTGGLPELGPPTVRQELVLDRQLRVFAGIPTFAYTVNGAVFPAITPTIVDEGDVVLVTVVNRSSESHPMHPHGHHALVLSRDGEPAQSALWLDTIDVRPGETWTFAIVADNPGIWMDHCHNLEHAATGMMFSLSYRGVVSPFSHGGEHGNRPE